MTGKTKSVLSYFYVAQIQVSPENDLLYEPFGVANSDDAALVLSIKELGVQEPLTLSNDGFLLSGHRRLAAAKYLRLETVPVRFKDVNFTELSKPERLEELRSFNQQRDKTPGEKIREHLLQIDPQEAYSELCRKRVTQQLEAVTSNVDVGPEKTRVRITVDKFMEAAQKVIWTIRNTGRGLCTGSAAPASAQAAGYPPRRGLASHSGGAVVNDDRTKRVMTHQTACFDPCNDMVHTI
jgi:hypothetical protein